MDDEARRTILVVEDDQELRAVMAEVLAELGHAVLCAAEGGEALRLLGAGAQVDVILLDLLMPGVDGYEFRARQLADEGLAAIPVIILSAGGERRPAPLGEVTYLRKPVELDELTATVAALLG
ncbi:MAG TPA: response regulator [Polyangia bacterium]|jgi:CheY-like chemotaxis protein